MLCYWMSLVNVKRFPDKSTWTSLDKNVIYWIQKSATHIALLRCFVRIDNLLWVFQLWFIWNHKINVFCSASSQKLWLEFSFFSFIRSSSSHKKGQTKREREWKRGKQCETTMSNSYSYSNINLYRKSLSVCVVRCEILKMNRWKIHVERNNLWLRINL